MCGISGFSGLFSPEVLELMSSKLAHRGPDGSGIFYDSENNIGLAHQRLAIIDLSPRGSQPMFDSSGRVSIIFNGEIYNYRELRKNLLGCGFTFLGDSDTEVLLNLYLRYGESMLAQLNGVFAFAIWDARSKSLFIARDPLGVKPFYYSNTSLGFVFASEMKALLAVPEVNREIDPYAVQLHLTYLWCPAPLTILKDVKKLPPGCALRVTGNEIHTWQYYSLPYGEPLLLGDVDDCAAVVSQSIRSAVERQMVSDVPVGSFLSGGLDSSAIAAFARDYVDVGKLQCFTIAFQDKKFQKEGFSSDLPYAIKVAKHLNVDLNIVEVGTDSLIHLEKMIYQLDEPLADLAPLSVLLISECARQSGIKVLLSGAGGDDIFSGYRRHYALEQERYWDWMPESLRIALAKSLGNLKGASPVVRRLRKGFEYADLSADDRLISYFYWGKPNRILKLMSKQNQSMISGKDVSEQLRVSLLDLPPNTPALNKMLYLETKFFLPDHNLNYTDKMSMSAGVEVRVPLLDLDLVRVAASLPASMKQKGVEGKWIFKKAMEKYLPHDVIYRPKTGFGAPIRSWISEEGHLNSLVRQNLSRASIQNRGIFDADEVEKLIQENSDGRIDASYTIFSMLCIEMWCRCFIDDGIKL